MDRSLLFREMQDALKKANAHFMALDSLRTEGRLSSAPSEEVLAQIEALEEGWQCQMKRHQQAFKEYHQLQEGSGQSA